MQELSHPHPQQRIPAMLPQTSSEELQTRNNHRTMEEGIKTSMPADSNDSHSQDSKISTYNENTVEQTRPLYKTSTPNDRTASRSQPAQNCSPRHPSFSPLTPAASSNGPLPAFSPLSSTDMPRKRRKTTLQNPNQGPRPGRSDNRSMTFSEIAASQGKDKTLADVIGILRAPVESASHTSPPPPPASAPPTDQLRHPSLPPTVRPSFAPGLEAPRPTQPINDSPATFTNPYLNTLFTKPRYSPQTPSTPLPSGPNLPKISNFSRRPSTHRPTRDPHAVVEEREIHCGVCDERLAAHQRMRLVRCDVGGCGRWYHLDCLGMEGPPSRRVAWECPGHGGWGRVLSDEEDEEEEGDDDEAEEEEGMEEQEAVAEKGGDVERRRSGRIMASASARGGKKSTVLKQQPPAPTTSSSPPSPTTSDTAPDPEPEPQQAPPLPPPPTQGTNSAMALSRRHRGRNTQSPPSDKTFTCKLCNRRFRRQEHLKRHYASLHTHEKPFECGECGRRFSRMDNLGQHARVHGGGGGDGGSGGEEGEGG